MKKLIRAILLILVVIFSSSCSDFLDKAPEEDLTIEDAFKQRQYAERFLFSAYAGLPLELYFSDMGDANPFVLGSDELNMPYPEKYGKLINRGSWNPHNAHGQIWINMYEGIRKTNIFLENIDLTPLSNEFTQSDKERWVAEATLLRAYYHFRTLKIYGPIPIVDHKVELDEDFSLLKRKPLDECIQFILDECDKAIPYLPMRITNTTQYGKVTAAFAYALKARLLLYRASPLWNGNSDYINFTDNEGVHLFPREADRNRWKIAADAAKTCIDICEQAGYGLYRSADNDPIENIKGIYLVRHNRETLLGRNHQYMDGLVEKCCFPRTNGGWGSFNPTQNLIDAYEMANGEIAILGYNPDSSPIINPQSGYREDGYAEADGLDGRWLQGVRNMYVSRDPRFYASINFNGKLFKGRRLEWWNTGADGRGNEGRDYNTTGYTMNKYVDEDVDIPQGRFSLKTWILFRLGEQYLNYAEALNETEGPVEDVYKYVNLIRDRAGMPPLPPNLNQDQMRDRIWRERRVELAFEAHRFFDCRRWKIAQYTDDGPIYGMNIETGAHLQDDAFYQRVIVEERVFKAPTHYLFPIFQNEIDRNPELVQNPGW
jgi:hypothetical protein